MQLLIQQGLILFGGNVKLKVNVMLQNPQADYYEIVGARPQLVSDASKEQEEDRFTLKDFEI